MSYNRNQFVEELQFEIASRIVMISDIYNSENALKSIKLLSQKAWSMNFYKFGITDKFSKITLLAIKAYDFETRKYCIRKIRYEALAIKKKLAYEKA